MGPNMFFGYFEAIIVKDAHIRDETFQVTIPSLCMAAEKKDKGQKVISYMIEGDKINNSKELGVKNKKFQSTTIITALNHTDYTYQYKGDTTEMERSKFNTKKDLTDQGGIMIQPLTNPYQLFVPHYHEGKDPISMWNYVYKELNNVKVKKGTKCYGFFINGENDPDRFAVTHIEGAIPLNKSKLPKYVK